MPAALCAMPDCIRPATSHCPSAGWDLCHCCGDFAAAIGLLVLPLTGATP